MVRTIRCCNGGVAQHDKEIRQAILDDGFVYLLDYGITPDTVEKVFAESDKFFAQSLIEKRKFLRQDDNSGYVAEGMESFDRSVKREVREAYNVNSPENRFPNQEMKQILVDFSEQCWSLCKELLTVLAPQLNVSEQEFIGWHRSYFGKDNGTTLRLLHYPAFPEANDSSITRCGAHTDYGTITLLWQDDVGGLELKTENGFESIVPVKNAVLVNTGGTLEIWSGGRIRAGEHRVSWRDRERRAIAFFLHPDDETPVVPAPFDTTNTVISMNAKQYNAMRFGSTYS